jgi:hypothetical protein
MTDRKCYPCGGKDMDLEQCKICASHNEMGMLCVELFDIHTRTKEIQKMITDLKNDTGKVKAQAGDYICRTLDAMPTGEKRKRLITHLDTLLRRCEKEEELVYLSVFP